MNTARTEAVARPLPERCCPPGQCTYRASAVDGYLKALRRLARDREDLADEASLIKMSDGGNQDGGGLGSGDSASRYLIRLVDVQMATEQLRTEGKLITPETVSARLCPYSDEEQV